MTFRLMVFRLLIAPANLWMYFVAFLCGYTFHEGPVFDEDEELP